MYIQKCQELEVYPNPHALPKPDTEHTIGLSKQGSLNSFIEATPNIKWSRQGLLEHIIDFIISDDQVSLVYYHLSSRFLIYPSVFPACQCKSIPIALEVPTSSHKRVRYPRSNQAVGGGH